MSIGIGYPGLVDSDVTTVSGSGWETALPAANVLTRDLGQVAQSTGTTATLTLDHGSAQTARALVIMPGHNLRAGDTVRWKRGTTSGGAEVADSTALAAYTITPLVYGDHPIIIVLSASSSARYDTLTIGATTNPDGYVRLPHVWVSDLFVPQYGPQYGLQDGLQALGSIERSAGGVGWANGQGSLRQVSMVLPYLSLDEGDTLHEVMRVAERTDWALYVPNLTDRAIQQRYGFAGTFEELSPVDYPYYRARSLPLRFTEAR